MGTVPQGGPAAAHRGTRCPGTDAHALPACNTRPSHLALLPPPSPQLFYTQVSPGMRSLGTSFYLLTVCIGTYLAVALNLIIDGATGGTWVASNPIFAQYNLYM